MLAPILAATWNLINSGTSDDITAIDNRTAVMHFATANGAIWNVINFVPTLEASFTGRHFFAIAFNPSGTIGLAAADTGHLYRFSTGSWTAVSLTNKSFNFTTCSATPLATVGAATPTADLLSVAWATDTVAWVVSAANGQILKSLDGGATWAEASRKNDQTCKLPANITGVAPVTDQLAYFVSDNFGQLYLTSDQLATPAQAKVALENCPNTRAHVAVDPSNPNTVSGLGECNVAPQWTVSADGGANATPLTSFGTLRALAAQAFELLAVGDAGEIEQSFNAASPFMSTFLQGTNWHAVSFADHANAAIGGTNGTLAISSDADQPPPVLSDDFFFDDGPGRFDDLGNPVTVTDPGGSACCRTSHSRGNEIVALAVAFVVIPRRRRARLRA